MRLELKESEIIWMGRSPSKPEGFMIPTHLKVRYTNSLTPTHHHCAPYNINIIIVFLQVLTIEETPFVYARKVETEIDCTPNEIPCPHYNTSDATGK